DFLVVNLLEAKLGGDALLQKAQRRLLEARRKVKMRQQNRLPLDLVLAGANRLSGKLGALPDGGATRSCCLAQRPRFLCPFDRQEGSGGRITGDADYLALRARKIGWRTCINGSSPCRSAGTRRAPLGNACWPRSKPADYTTNGGGERDIAPSAVLPSALGAALVALEKIARITARFTEPLPFCRRSS
ncbi:MAG TPA: hypothetical protein VNV39_10325, partial [Stellaceae bacterium]|nr:hypothetical protein [Stellaceae bacterium]